MAFLLGGFKWICQLYLEDGWLINKMFFFVVGQPLHPPTRKPWTHFMALFSTWRRNRRVRRVRVSRSSGVWCTLPWRDEVGQDVASASEKSSRIAMQKWKQRFLRQREHREIREVVGIWLVWQRVLRVVQWDSNRMLFHHRAFCDPFPHKQKFSILVSLVIRLSVKSSAFTSTNHSSSASPGFRIPTEQSCLWLLSSYQSSLKSRCKPLWWTMIQHDPPVPMPGFCGQKSNWAWIEFAHPGLSNPSTTPTIAT